MSKTKTFFPGYILVEAILDKETKHLILNTPSVISFVGPKGEPVPLQPDEVRRLIGRMEERKDVEAVYKKLQNDRAANKQKKLFFE